MAILAVLLQRLVAIGQGSARAAGDSDIELPHVEDNSTATLYRVPLLHLAEVVAPAALTLGIWTAANDWDATVAAHCWALVVATICITTCYMLLAWQYRSPGRTWIGSLVAMAGLFHAAVSNYPDLVWQPWLTGLLGHSTLAALAAVLVGEWGKRAGPMVWPANCAASSARRWVTAVLSSMLTLPVLPFVSLPSTESLAGCLYWLSAIWLAIAWRRRNALLFAAHQFILATATAVATTAWLEHQSWVAKTPDGLWHPYSLQTYGIALGVLSLLWVFARILLRITRQPGSSSSRPRPRWTGFRGTPWSRSSCWWWHSICNRPSERNWSADSGGSASFHHLQQAAFGGGAWLLIGILAAMLTATLWDRWRRAELTSALLLAATLPCLIAGRFAGDLAVASALRWGVAVCFLIVSAAIWERNRLLRACRLAHTNLDLDFSGLPVAQHVAIWTTAVPVLGLTVVAAACLFSGIEPGGPAAGTLFAWFGPKVSYLVPLVLVLLALVGHALRESSAGYAFFAGLVGELAVTLGYALSVVLAGRSFAADEWATLLNWQRLLPRRGPLAGSPRGDGWTCGASMPPADRKRPPRFLDRGNQRQVLPPPRV